MARGVKAQRSARRSGAARIRASAVLSFVAVLGGGSVVPASALADPPRVIVVRVRDEPPVDAFVAALRLQIGSAASVEIGPVVDAATLRARMEAAARVGEASDVALVVWVEYGEPTNDSDVDVVLYAVERDPNRALVGIASVPHADRPEDHRVLALKVGHLLDLLLEDDASGERLERAFAGGPRPSPFALVVELGAAGAVGAGSVGPQIGLAGGVGLSFRSDDLALELVATIRWMSTLDARNSAGSLRLGEIDAGVSARGLSAWGWFRAGVDLELGARVIDASGRAADGRTDSLVRVVPVLSGGLEARARPFANFEVRAVAGVALALVEQRFSLVEVPIANLGRARPFAGLSLIVSVP
jgi:hypothetical protein